MFGPCVASWLAPVLTLLGVRALYMYVRLQVNLFFLCNILRTLMFQLHAHPHEPSNFRYGIMHVAIQSRLCKSTFALKRKVMYVKQLKL